MTDISPSVTDTQGGTVTAQAHPRSMNKNLAELLKSIPQQPQRQDSASEQLRDLYQFANRLGMYDAADLIKCDLVNSGLMKS